MGIKHGHGGNTDYESRHYRQLNKCMLVNGSNASTPNLMELHDIFQTSI